MFGFLTGAGFVFVATLGLVIAFIEFLRPVLIPGIDLLVRLLPQEVIQAFPVSPFIPGIILNGLIYAGLFLAISLAKESISNRTFRVSAIALLILGFLALTGMIADFLVFLGSPDKSWIFEIGA